MSIPPISANQREQRVTDMFLRLHEGRAVYKFRALLRMLYSEYDSICPGESILERDRDTCWIKVWDAANPDMGKRTRYMRLYALKTLMHFLYENNEVHANIYEVLDLTAPPGEQNIRFPETSFSIQREFDAWRNENRNIGDHFWSVRRTSVLRFAVFSSRNHSSSWCSYESIHSWIRHLSGHLEFKTVWIYARALDMFLRFLYESGKIEENPLNTLQQEFSLHRFDGIVRALSEENCHAAFEGLRKQSSFKSYLSAEFIGYLKLKRATGRRYEYEETMLRKLDNYISENDLPLNSETAQKWISTLSYLHSTTQNHYYSQARMFCEYLARTRSDAPVLYRHYAPMTKPLRVPFILCVDEITRLVQAVDTLNETWKCPMRKLMYRTMIILFYCCGLRLGEVLRLNIGDVDIENGVLTIRNTKFYKTRLVPMSQQVTHLVSVCIENKRAKGISCDTEAPLFSSSRNKRYFKTSVRTVMNQLMIRAGIRREDTRKVRIHDLRHTFAVHRLIAWYKNGDDVQAKLPILSQYMGHIDIYNTRRYLTMVPELAEAAMQRFHEYAVNLRRLDENED